MRKGLGSPTSGAITYESAEAGLHSAGLAEELNQRHGRQVEVGRTVLLELDPSLKEAYSFPWVAMLAPAGTG